MFAVTGGSTDVTTYFKLTKTADGLEATGLTITDLDLQYVRSGVVPAAKVDATALAATDSAHADNKAIEIDGTDQPGVYRVDWPDAAFAAGVKEVILTLKHASCFTEELRVLIDPPTNVVKWLGTAPETPNTAGVPIVDVGYVDGEAATTALPGDELADTTIATLATQTSFTLTAGSADDDAYSGCMAVFIDQSTSTQRARCTISGYTGSTKTVTLAAAPEFTIATGDTVKIVAVPKQLSGHVPQTGDAYAIVNSGTHGNAALKNEHDATQTLIDDLPTNAELATALAAADDAVLAQVALVKAKTDNLPSDPADQSLIIDATNALATLIGDVPTNAELATALAAADDAVLAAIAALNNLSSAQAQTAAAAALAAYDPPTKAELDAADDAVLAAIAALNNLSAADVNAQVLDVLNVDTFAQPGQENPAATQTLVKMLAYLYKAWRNKTTQTSSEYALYADDGSTKDQEAVVSDDGTTTTRGEVGTGA